LQVIISVLEGLPGRDITPFSLAVLFVFRTGVSWTDLPSCFGNWHTVYTRFKRWSENGLFLVCCTDCSKERRLKWIWFGSTAQQLACTVLGSGVLKNQNPPLGGEERAEALKIHVGLCQGILCGACLYASNKLDTSVFNELWARGNWDAIAVCLSSRMLLYPFGTRFHFFNQKLFKGLKKPPLNSFFKLFLARMRGFRVLGSS